MVKNLPANAGFAGGLGSIPGLGRSPGVENGNPSQDSCMKNPMDRGAWWAIVHGVVKELDTSEHMHTHVVHHAGGHAGGASREQLSQAGGESTEREDLWASVFTGGQGGVHNKSHKGFCWCV